MVCFNEEIKLAGSIDMVFQDKYTKEFHIYDWKRVKEISYDSTFNKFAKQSVYRTCQTRTFGIIASIEHL
jgi:hypothetical protein